MKRYPHVNYERMKRPVAITTLTYDLEGSVEGAIETLQRYQKEYPGCTLSYEDVADSYSPERMGLVLYANVDETDTEMAARIHGEERERKEFERLREKYGK